MPSKGIRLRAEELFQKAQRTDKEVQSIADDERAAVRGKTARLKAQRLAKEAGGSEPEPEPADPEKRKPSGRE